MADRNRLPSAREVLEHLREALAKGQLYLFLDYDGTLTPIVERPEDAVLAPAMRSRLAELAERCFLAIVSGRGRADLTARVGIEGIAYAGSHGLELVPPDGSTKEAPEAQAALPALDAAERELRSALGPVAGAQLERKRFGLAVHYRRVAAETVPQVENAVQAALAAQAGQLKLKSGKKVWEFVPDLDWDKGKALGWILDRIGADPRAASIVYLGDDITDEDAFRAIADTGIGIAVGDGPEDTAATHRLADVDAVERFLAALAATAERTPPAT